MKSVKSRLIIYILSASIIPIVAFLLYTTFFVSDGLIESEIESNETKIIWSEQYLEQLTNQLEDIVYSVHLEEGLLSKVDNSGTTYDDIEEIVRSTLYNNSNILSKVSVISTNTMRGVSFDYENGFVSKTYLNDDFYLDEGVSQEALKFVQDGNDTFIIHTINNFETKNLEGVIILRLSDEPLSELDTIFSMTSSYVLYNSNETISNSDTYDISSIKETLKNHTNGYYKDQDDLFWTRRVSDYDLYITLIVNEKEVEAFSRNMIGVGLIIIVTSFLVTIVVSVLVSREITNPLTKLVDHMKNTKLTKTKDTSHSYEEINVLESAYNQMIDEINQLIEEQYRSEIDRQNIQLKALQAQINPHFLANTFQLIGGMALEQGASDIYDATIKMSQLVRYSMRIEQNAVTIKEELIHIKDYLDIQKLRYGDRLSYKVEMDDDIKDIKIPKFTIQPIIENAFKHGLKKVDRPWQIKITNTITENDVFIHVIDNGKGMSDKEIKDINQLLQTNLDHVDEKSIGIKNISSRLKLLYGNQYGIKIQKNKTTGIEVILHLPKKGGKQ